MAWHGDTYSIFEETQSFSGFIFFGARPQSGADAKGRPCVDSGLVTQCQGKKNAVSDLRQNMRNLFDISENWCQHGMAYTGGKWLLRGPTQGEERQGA